MPNPIYTIGHSRHEWEIFLALLKTHGIETLVDVRSKPVSRFARFANKRALPYLLEKEGIRYAFMGDTLGGKPAGESYYDSRGNPDYAKIAAEPAFKKGIDELVKLSQESRTAIMCAEEDPAKCHRRLLIGPALIERGVELRHIRKDGAAQIEEDVVNLQGRLL